MTDTTPKEVALKTCPFCGQQPHVEERGDGGDCVPPYRTASCQNKSCGLAGHWMAVDLWECRAFAKTLEGTLMVDIERAANNLLSDVENEIATEILAGNVVKEARARGEHVGIRKMRDAVLTDALSTESKEDRFLARGTGK